MTHGSDAVGDLFIDIDEWRDSPRPHRYVHGGFVGTHTLFSCYFPPAEQYRGRLLQYLEGGSGGHETLLPFQAWAFPVAFDDLGCFLVESNQGHYPDEGTGFADDWELFGASAHCALAARELAAQMYGEAPHHGYVFGGSGGGSRSIYCLENRPDVYDGASPHVIWSSPLGSNWSPAGYWWLHARGKLAEIIDAVEPGGSGNPFAGLDVAQREALAALYRFGFPRGAESQLWSFSPWTWGLVSSKESDPGYYDDFWSTAGYLGHDDPQRLAHLVIDTKATVTRVLSAAEAGADIAFVLAATAGAGRDHSVGISIDSNVADPDALFGARITFTTGRAAGRSVVISTVAADILSTSGEHAPQLFDGVEPGDELTVDNRDFIAWCHLWQHALSLDLVSTGDGAGGRRYLPGFDGLRAYAVDDRPVFPQRPKPIVPQEGGGTGHSGRFTGKMIHVNATHDAQVWPNGVLAYRAKVEADKGERTNGSYRLWWVEHAPHGTPQVLGPALTPEKDPGVWRSRLVDYDGVTARALRDLVVWVEQDAAPPSSTDFVMTGDGDVRLCQDPGQRGGVQPVAHATANGAIRAEVCVGEPVTLTGIGQQPGPGAIVAAEWDPEGTGRFEQFKVDGSLPSVTVEITHAYARPGTYLACFRVGAHRDGAPGTKPYARNNARVRVVVSEKS
jgi:hypothetical protein